MGTTKVSYKDSEMEEVQKKVWINPKDHPFVSGCALTFLSCCAFGGMYLHLNGIRIDNYQNKITELKHYEAESKEGVKAQHQLTLLQVEYENLKNQYDTLVGENWKQKYEAEYIRNLALTEQLTLDATRLNDGIARMRDELKEAQKQKRELELRLASIAPVKEKAVGDGLKAFDELLLEKKKLQENNDAVKREKESQAMQIAELSDKLLTTEQEVERLRNLILQTSNANNIKGHNDMASKADIDMICAALENVSQDSVAAKIINEQLTVLSKRISGEDFAKILNAADISDDSIAEQVIVTAAPYLVYPLSPKIIRTILGSISDDSIQEKIIKALGKAQATQAKTK